MLKIALAPAPVAHGEVDQARRNFLVGALQLGRHAHPPARAAQQRGFDEIVAEDLPAEGRLAGQMRQPGAFQKARHADDGVVAPEIADAAMPESQARRHHRPVDAAGELLHPGEQRVAVDGRRATSGSGRYPDGLPWRRPASPWSRRSSGCRRRARACNRRRGPSGGTSRRRCPPSCRCWSSGGGNKDAAPAAAARRGLERRPPHEPRCRGRWCR